MSVRRKKRRRKAGKAKKSMARKTSKRGLHTAQRDVANTDAGICGLCGMTGADSREHVLGRVFFAPPFPNPGWTLPAHKECNHSTHKDEEWIASISTIIHPDQERMAAISKRRVDALRRPESERF